MDVFVLSTGCYYEGSSVEALYTTLDAAFAAAAAFMHEEDEDHRDREERYNARYRRDARPVDMGAWDFYAHEDGDYYSWANREIQRVASIRRMAVQTQAPAPMGATFGEILADALGEDTPDAYEEPRERTSRPRWRFHCGCSHCNGRTWKRFRRAQYRAVDVA